MVGLRCDSTAQLPPPAPSAWGAPVGPAAAGFGVRPAQCRMAQPPATSAAPTSASRWMLRPVNASELGAAAVVSPAVLAPSGPLAPTVPPAPTDAPVPPVVALVETPSDPPPPPTPTA